MISLQTPSNTRFLWGAATSAHQVEGDNQHSDWWHWETNPNSPCVEPSGKASSHLTHWKDDLTTLQSLGLNAYRFSIEWAKLEPKKGSWNESYFQWILSLLEACREKGLAPVVTLHHFTNPLWFAGEGGFSERGSHRTFLHYVDRLLLRLKSEVLEEHLPRLWIPFNEPVPQVIGAYLANFQPPGIFDPKKATIAFEEMLLAHEAIYKSLHALHLKGTQVGVAQNQLDWLPERRLNPLDQLIAWFLRDFYNHAWIDCALGERTRFGIPGFLRVRLKRKLERSLDFIGINYYTEARVGFLPKERDTHLDRHSKMSRAIGLRFCDHRSGRPHSDLNWVVSPEGFYRTLRRAITRFQGVPLYVTENGLADRTDDRRADFLRSHLNVVQTLRSEGAPLYGYFHWSLLDNFEWIEGFAPRFGLIAIDYKTGTRTLRPSALTYRDQVQNEPHESILTQVQHTSSSLTS